MGQSDSVGVWNVNHAVTRDGEPAREEISIELVWVSKCLAIEATP